MASRLRSSTRASTVASDLLAEQGGDTKAAKESRTRSTSARAPKASEMARLIRIALVAFFASWVLMGAVVYYTLNDTLRLYPSTIKPESLKGFNARAEFSLRHQTLLFFWLFFNLHYVIYYRITRKAFNPLVDSTERLVQEQKNILTNSYEQIVLSVFLQLTFASFADPALVMKLIPVVNVVQFVGRVAFFLGYPLYRTFGVSLTMGPNTLMLFYNVYSFGSYLGFY